MIFETENVEVHSAENGKPRQPPDRLDGVETPQMAASSQVSCEFCNNNVYIVGEHPSMYTDKEVKFVCESCEDGFG